MVSELDEAAGADDSEGQATVDRVVRQARDLFVPPDRQESRSAEEYAR